MNRDRDVLRTEDIMAKHGLPSPAFGRLTFNCLRGGRRIGWSFVEAPFGGILAEEI